MNLKLFLDLWPIFVLIGSLIVTGIVTWTRVTDKLQSHDNRLQAGETRMAGFERELAEYRRDAQESAKSLARVEKGVAELRESQSGHFRRLEKTIQDRELSTVARLTRVETLVKVEEKVGSVDDA
jgi:hypothetical protein